LVVGSWLLDWIDEMTSTSRKGSGKYLEEEAVSRFHFRPLTRYYVTTISNHTTNTKHSKAFNESSQGNGENLNLIKLFLSLFSGCLCGR
jgi:hypothetical protein